MDGGKKIFRHSIKDFISPACFDFEFFLLVSFLFSCRVFQIWGAFGNQDFSFSFIKIVSTPTFFFFFLAGKILFSPYIYGFLVITAKHLLLMIFAKWVHISVVLKFKNTYIHNHYKHTLIIYIYYIWKRFRPIIFILIYNWKKKISLIR